VRGVVDRPGSVRALSALLVVEVATLAFVVLFSLVVAAIGLVLRRDDSWSDLVGTVGLAAAGVAAVPLVAVALAWVMLRRRASRAFVIASSIGHLAPTLALLVIGLGTGTGQSLVVLGAAVVGLAGLVLSFWPSTRAWLRGPLHAE
jgi:O-antigen/teichoic acid export membrane protein